MSDLGRHRVAYLLRGLPLYDDDDQVIGFVDEPEWDWTDLTPDQQAEIEDTVQECMAPGSTRDEVFPFVLGEFGIRCPHRWINREPLWRECSWCGAHETLPGRVVLVAGQEMRVPNPPPPILRIPIPQPLTAGLQPSTLDLPPQYEEYRWNGRRYVGESTDG